MNWLAICWALQLGYMPVQQQVMWKSPQCATEATMESTIVLFDHIEIGGMFKGYQVPAGNGYFMPFRMDYGIHADIMFKTETSSLRIGISHECDHSITLESSLRLLSFWRWLPRRSTSGLNRSFTSNISPPCSSRRRLCKQTTALPCSYWQAECT